MKLSVVILTWNSKQYIKRCISSVLGSITEKSFEIIVVDNGSTDDTIEILKKFFPFVTLIMNNVNRGVAPARNQGINVAQGKYVLILDIDTYVYPGALDKLLDYMDRHSDVGIIGPRMVFEDGIVQNTCRKFPLLYTKVLRRINSEWAVKLLENEQYLIQMKSNTAFDVDYVIGACQLIRHKALDEIGLLDENIFYGPEDVDICLRMWVKGWKVRYIPDVVIIHFEQRVTKKKILSSLMLKHIKGLLYYFIKHRYCLTRKRIYKKMRARNK